MMTKPMWLLLLWVLACAGTASAQRQMESLGRGVVAVRTSATQTYVGWRLLGTDPEEVGFNLYRVRGGVTHLLNGSPLTASCNYLDTPPNFNEALTYLVRPVLGGIEGAASDFYTLPASAPVRQYLSVPLQIPPGGVTPNGESYSYNANDCSVADLDGDGECEIVLKWDPTNSKDNSQSGYTGNVLLDAYKLNGTRLWRIDLGVNIRAGAHYTQFMVYDLDGDGKAELVCKTAEGSRDGQGGFVANHPARFTGAFPTVNNAADHRSAAGYVLLGYEFLTVFHGETGAELATTYYNPPRNHDLHSSNVSAWGDNYGNRVDRFLACIAYLDGVRPSVVMCRGYYTRAVLAAWDWRGGQLTPRWVFDSDDGTPGNLAYRGEGAHCLTVGDVDGDGRDEITYGACAIDDDGTGLYATGIGHGDALHLSDMDPLRPGLEVWMVHECVSCFGEYGLRFRDACTGETLFGVDGQNSDVGRGVAIDIDPNYPGYEMWGSRGGLMNATGMQLPFNKPSPQNFALYWDADLNREILDGTTISKYNPANGSVSSVSLSGGGGLSSNNGTKSTPALSVDLFGDWREEVIWRTSGNGELRIFTTTQMATNRIPTLMHDPQYRLAIAWQNVAYNQPPHPGFFLGAGMAPPPRAPVSSAPLAWHGDNDGNAWTANHNWLVNDIWTHDQATSFASGDAVLFDLRAANQPFVSIPETVTPGDITVHSASNFTFTGSGSLSGSARLFKAGPGRLTLDNTNHFTGGTFVSGGQLIVNGSLNASPVVIEARGEPWGRARIAGSGRLGQGLTVQQDCGIIVGPGLKATGTLTITNGLTELGGVLNQFDLSRNPGGGNNDRMDIVGNLTLTGSNVIEITQLDGSLGEGIYPLITYSGTLSGGLGNLGLTGVFKQSVVLTNPPGMIALVATLPGSPPAAPTSLTATSIGAFQINLSWTDNSPDETEFLIDRSTDNVVFTPLVSVVENTTTHVDLGLLPNKTYYYRVRALNLAGASAFAAASATTPPLPASLTWRGDGTANLWDRAGTANWQEGSTLGVYDDGVAVFFDQSGSNSPAISLAETLQPASVTVAASKDYTFSGAGSLGGPMALVKSGSGRLTLNQGNSFLGGVTLNGGDLTLGNTLAAGAGALRFNGGSVTLNVGSQQTYAQALEVLSSGTVISAGGNNNIVSGPWTGAGNTTLHLRMASGTFTLGGNLTSFQGTVALDDSAGFFRFHGSTGSAATTFDLGTGTVTLNNRNGVTVTLGALQGGSETSVSGAGAVNAPSTYVIGGKNLDSAYAGTVRDANAQRTVAITKVGGGTLTLTGTNTYSGATSIHAGTLRLNGDHSACSGDVVVGAAGTLAGAGVIGGNTTVQGRLSPGSSLGTLTFAADLTLASDSSSLLEISKLPLAHDAVLSLGHLTLGGTLVVVNVSVESLEENDSFALFNAASLSGAFAEYSLPPLDSGLVWDTSLLSTRGLLRVLAVSRPAFAETVLLEGNLVICGSGGVPGATYYLLSSPHLGIPLPQWKRVWTNQFEDDGGFRATNSLGDSSSSMFYSIEVP